MSSRSDDNKWLSGEEVVTILDELPHCPMLAEPVVFNALIGNHDAHAKNSPHVFG